MAAQQRLTGLDQARAVAILTMLVAHFVPGTIDRLPILEPFRIPSLWIARLATPTFVVVFGVTSGFVLVPRYAETGHRQMSHRLWRRAAVMFGCALILALPHCIRLAVDSVTDPWAWMFGLYSVLLFYALALAVFPAWLWSLDSRPSTRAVQFGVALWALGTAGHNLWPQGPPSAPEFIRMMLVSGSFAYLQLMGTALIALPVGVQLHRAWQARTERRLLLWLLAAGPILAALGGIWGWAIGEYDPARIMSGELRTPPRAWYYVHFGGAGLTLIPALERLYRSVRRLRPALYVLALFGQIGLIVFTGHAFVLPALAVIDRLHPSHGAARVALALGPFAAFCASALYWRHRQVVRRTSSQPTSQPTSNTSPTKYIESE